MDGVEGVDSTQVGVDTGGEQGSTGINPAWQEFYGNAPEDVRDQYLTPAFQKWEANVNNMVQKVHSEYEPWKPVMQQVDPNTASWAIQVANALNTDPKMVYEALGEWIGQQNNVSGQQNPQSGLIPGQGQQQPNSNQEEQPWRPELASLQQQNKLMVDYLTAQQQQQQAAQADAQLEQELSTVRQKYNLQEKDMPFVLGLMANNDFTTEDAAKAVAEYSGSFRPKPLIMGSGGGVPGAGINPAKLDDKSTKNLVVQMLAANQAQNQ
jgi:hypothetical protein